MSDERPSEGALAAYQLRIDNLKAMGEYYSVAQTLLDELRAERERYAELETWLNEAE